MTDMYSWQQEIWSKLAKRSELLGHALLFKGKQGIGKYDFARFFAQSLLCATPKADQKACGACLSCGWFEHNTHPNFFMILPEALQIDSVEQGYKEKSEEKTTGSAMIKKNPSQHISIEQIRKLNDFVYLTGHQHGYKIVLIYRAETMNIAAANALLKKLEEPPENVLFILVTHQAQRLLPTIRSRCQQIAMPIPDVAASIVWLKQHAIRDPQASLAAASYAPLSALWLNSGEITQHYEQFIRLLSDPERLNPVSGAQMMQQVNLPVVVNWLQQWCYDLVSYRTTGKIRYFLNQMVCIASLSEQIDLHACLAYVRTLNTSQKLVHHPLNPRLFLEEMLINYVAMIGKK